VVPPCAGLGEQQQAKTCQTPQNRLDHVAARLTLLTEIPHTTHTARPIIATRYSSFHRLPVAWTV
jgi:hypothetical protein